MRLAGGENLDIIIEMHANTDTAAAIQIGQALQGLRIFYYEEPSHSLNTGNFEEIKKKVNIPLAAGERIYTRHGYRPFFEDRLLSVAQPDLCLCGGLTEAKKFRTWHGFTTLAYRSMFAEVRYLRLPLCSWKQRFLILSYMSTTKDPWDWKCGAHASMIISR